jgi:hypothetical protein
MIKLHMRYMPLMNLRGSRGLEVHLTDCDETILLYSGLIPLHNRYVLYWVKYTGLGGSFLSSRNRETSLLVKGKTTINNHSVRLEASQAGSDEHQTKFISEPLRFLIYTVFVPPGHNDNGSFGFVPYD